MRVRGAVLALVLSLSAGTAQAQDQTLADIRQELQILFVQIQNLQRELNTTGTPTAGGPVGQGTIARVDALVAEVTRLNALTEELQLRVQQVASDGARQVTDLEFRLCELEADCDIASLEPLSTLGSGDPAIGSEIPDTPVTPEAQSPSFAVGEQGAFDTARAAFEAGDYADAATQLQTFTETYSGSALATEAQMLLGRAQSAQGNHREAARAYLAAFNADRSGPVAPGALLNLGRALQQLGQNDAACQTLGEVGARFPTAPEAAEASSSRNGFGCS